MNAKFSNDELCCPNWVLIPGGYQFCSKFGTYRVIKRPRKRLWDVELINGTHVLKESRRMKMEAIAIAAADYFNQLQITDPDLFIEARRR